MRAQQVRRIAEARTGGPAVHGASDPVARKAWLDRCVSVDLCFWESGDGDAEELYEDAAEGIDHTFTTSARVLEFRAELLRRWPDLADSVAPSEWDYDLEVPSDLKRYVLVTMHAGKSDRIPAMIDLALAYGLAGYDPQHGTAITR